jgi:hypothetical protein
MSDLTEIILIGCVVIIGIIMAVYGLYASISSSDLVTRTALFFPTAFGITMSTIWSFELKRKYEELHER